MTIIVLSLIGLLVVIVILYYMGKLGWVDKYHQIWKVLAILASISALVITLFTFYTFEESLRDKERSESTERLRLLDSFQQSSASNMRILSQILDKEGAPNLKDSFSITVLDDTQIKKLLASNLSLERTTLEKAISLHQQITIFNLDMKRYTDIITSGTIAQNMGELGMVRRNIQTSSSQIRTLYTQIGIDITKQTRSASQ